MKQTIVRISLFILISVFSPYVTASSLRISPISLQLTEKQYATTLTIYNQATDETTLQARVFLWQQENGQDILTPTQDLVISPPMMKLIPRRSYNYRIVRLDKTPIVQEKSYRVIIDEIPTANDKRKMDQGVQMLLRTSLPVFLTPHNAMAQLSWKFSDNSTAPALLIHNHGKRHAKLTELTLIDHTTNNEYPIRVSSVNGYILPEQFKSYYIADSSFSYQPQHHYSLKATVNKKSIEF